MTIKVIEQLQIISNLHLPPGDYSVIMEVITNITKMAYDEGFAHGENDGYGKGYYACSKNKEQENDSPF